MSSKIQKTIARQQEKYNISHTRIRFYMLKNILELHQVPITKPINNSVLLHRVMWKPATGLRL